MLAEKRHRYTGDCMPIGIKGCMKQHLIVFKPNSTEIVSWIPYCNGSHCIDLDFDNCTSSELSDDACANAEEEFEEKEYGSSHIWFFRNIIICNTY